MMLNIVKAIKKSSNKIFLVYSGIFFIVISLVAFTAYAISARQINRSYIEQQLAIASETIRLRLATIVNSELALVLKMADTPAIQNYFVNPYDSGLEALALVEFDTYLHHFEQKINFWINDVDKIFYSTGNEPYVVNPDDPDSYWYNLTLYQTEKYNFNINYNPDIHQIFLWVNVPVFTFIDGQRKPLGMLGTGINLTEFSEFVVKAYKEFDQNITPYTFNKFNEITSATDYELVYNKVFIHHYLGDAGEELIRVAHTLTGNESKSFVYDRKMYLISSIQEMEWYLAVSYSLPGLLALNQSMNTVFFGMLFLILFMFVVMNVFNARSEDAINKQNHQLLAANRKAEIASKAKSDFLAKVSHEIRTPMNAITGMSELLLRGDLSDESRSRVMDIKRASSNLISIINDILDFSKIEAGKLEINPVKYLLSSMVNDAVSIIRMRLMEKPIRFFTNIDSKIPNGLIGDEVRIRQVLLNLLSNAVKYTDKGHISVTFTGEQRTEGSIWLKIIIADTGHGIKAEDQARLFGDFVQVDINKSGIEGTGLGLAITKRLCMAMGGDITMESEYGKGSVFTVLVPQYIYSSAPFATVDNAAEKKVLVYERRAVYAKSVCWSLENMGINYTLVDDDKTFTEALVRGPEASKEHASSPKEWYFIFSGYGLYGEIKQILDGEVFRDGKKPPLALMIEWGTEAYVPDVRFVSLPVQSLSIANVLNGVADSNDYYDNSLGSGMVRFTIPRARILLVDDIATNLKVAEGLLSPYEATIDSCLSGLQAIELVKKNNYDLVFMDHMMPELDGIETTLMIRDLDDDRFRALPIIALTANVVSGMRELFLTKGFNDLLGKPIDISKLDEILGKWISKGKREHGKTVNENSVMGGGKTISSYVPLASPSLSFTIDGIDTAKGLVMTGGKTEGYLQVLSIFSKDAESRLPLLKAVPDAGSIGESALSSFVTQVHALKSASASIGAAEVSAEAEALEAAGKAGAMAFIGEHLPVFTKRLEELANNINIVLKSLEARQNRYASPENSSKQNSFAASESHLINKLGEALKSQKASEIEGILEELSQITIDVKIKDKLEKISDDVLLAEYDCAIETIKEISAIIGET